MVKSVAHTFIAEMEGPFCTGKVWREEVNSKKSNFHFAGVNTLILLQTVRTHSCEYPLDITGCLHSVSQPQVKIRILPDMAVTI